MYKMDSEYHFYICIKWIQNTNLDMDKMDSEHHF